MSKNKHKNKSLPKWQNKGYSETGASHTRKAFKGLTAKSGSPNEDINYNNMTLRERSRLFMMSGGLAMSALKTKRTNVIGCGLILKSVIDKDVLGLSDEQAAAWQAQAEKEFELWAENKNHCDAYGLNDYYKIQQLVFMNTLMNGDCFTLKAYNESAVTPMMPYSLRLKVIEADRVQTPTDVGVGGALYAATDGKTQSGNRIYDGVEVDKQGKVVAYHIRNNYRFEMNAEPTEWARVEAYGKETGLPNVIHTMADVERPCQYRGVPFIAPVLEQILQIRRYTDSELTAAVVESLFTAFVKTEANTDTVPFNDIPQDGEPLALNDNEYEMGAGNVLVMRPGEDVTFADPKRPAGGFQNFVEAVAVQIGASLEISKEILLKQFNSSYSASRAALLEFWKVVKMRREWFVADFCRPTYEAFIYEAVARGRLKAPGFFDDPIKRLAWLGATFSGPSQGMLDPIKEVTAEILACEQGFSTRAESSMRLNGSEFSKNISALKKENPLLFEANSVNALSDVIKGEFVKALTEQNGQGEQSKQEE